MRIANTQHVDDSAPPDLVREAFSQSCQMYRHFSMLRYYTFAIYGAVTAGIATLHFTQLPNMIPRDNAENAGFWIRICGATVPVICLVFEVCLTVSMIEYRHRMTELASKLGKSVFSASNLEHVIAWSMALAALVIYSISVIAWLCYAELPPHP